MQGTKKQPKGQGIRPVSFGKLFRFARKREKGLLVLGGFFILLAGFSLIANLLLTLYLLKDVSEVYYLQKSYTEALDGLKESTMYVFIVGLSMATLMYVGLSIYMFVGERIAYRLREAYMRSVLHMDMSWFDTLGAGEVTTRLTNDIDRIRDGIGEKVALLIMDTGIMLAIIVISFYLSAKLAIYVCSLLIFLPDCFVGW
ncbi:hypothetical protein DSO57_1007561 [Entomophthora muscae]|uniref:Uncharacterized protein n=1 Tax=Entomophthora muscae TaxID=34485 RepID=A0ACC2RM27_9FUNG|nr:hypothetical protein DSO57_1007561 [Entomophthora muscae]